MKISDLKVLVKGAGDIASGVVHTLARSHFKVCLTELPDPRAIRRSVSFSDAVYEGEKEVEGVIAKLISSPDEIVRTWKDGKVPILIDAKGELKHILKPDILIDATMAKRNGGTNIADAALVIGLGPGFKAGTDVHIVIETNRGHNLGRIIHRGEAESNTGIPGEVAGVTVDRVLRASTPGRLSTAKHIGDLIQAGEVVATVGDVPIKAQINGVIRGLLRDGTRVSAGTKVGDVDPRGIREYCYLISDKSKALAGGVLEAILERFNG
jgi:xanthine dehydrogenase accessory factor